MKIQRYKIEGRTFDSYLEAFQSGVKGKVMHLLCDNKTWTHIETFTQK